jgi:hypothetical protein
MNPRTKRLTAHIASPSKKFGTPTRTTRQLMARSSAETRALEPQILDARAQHAPREPRADGVGDRASGGDAEHAPFHRIERRRIRKRRAEGSD